MELSCFVLNCPKIISFGCGCKGTYIYFCTSHSSVHLSESPELNHALISPLKSVGSDSKSRIIQKFQDLLSHVSLLKSSTLFSLTEITSEANQILSKLSKINSFIKKVIFNIHSCNSVPMPINNSIQQRSSFQESHFRYFYENFRSFIKGDYNFFDLNNFSFGQDDYFQMIPEKEPNEEKKEFFQDWTKFKDLNLDSGNNEKREFLVENVEKKEFFAENVEKNEIWTENIQKRNSFVETFEKSDCLTEKSNKNECNPKDLKKSGLFPDFLHFFRDQSSDLISLNLSTLTIDQREINLKNNRCHFPCTALFDQDKLFIHGGRAKNVYSGSTSILNLKTWSLKSLSESSPISSARPCILNHKVFIFGGQLNWLPRSKSKMFDLVNLTWNSIADLPLAMSSTSALPIDRRLLIAGESKEILFVFDYQKNSYEKLYPRFEVSFKNALAKFLDSVFLISDMIFECKDYAINQWELVNITGLQDGSIVTNTVSRDFMVFFADFNGNVYRFNCLDKNVEVVLRFHY